MKLKNIPRILALLTALFFVPLLLSGGTLRSAETSPLSGQQMQYAVSECDVYAQTSIVSAQELLPANTVRITRCSSTKGGQQPGIVYIILLSFLLAAAVCILYLTVRRTDRDIGRIRRFIIKYIHDKDGHKSSPFVLLLKTIQRRYYFMMNIVIIVLGVLLLAGMLLLDFFISRGQSGHSAGGKNDKDSEVDKNEKNQDSLHHRSGD